MTHAPMINTGIKLIQSCDITNLVNNSSMPITQLWLEASHPQMLLIYAYCKGRSCKTVLAVEGIFCWNHLFRSGSGFA